MTEKINILFTRSRFWLPESSLYFGKLQYHDWIFFPPLWVTYSDNLSLSPVGQHLPGRVKRRRRCGPSALKWRRRCGESSLRLLHHSVSVHAAGRDVIPPHLLTTSSSSRGVQSIFFPLSYRSVGKKTP